MAVVRFDEALLAKFPTTYTLVQSSYLQQFFTYIIDSKYRVGVDLRKWLADQVVAPIALPVELLQTNLKSYDDIVLAVLAWTIDNLVYTPDDVQWHEAEYWQTAQYTIKALKGDCEDGAILMYRLCRQLGVPEERLLLWAGNARAPNGQTAGHCCLFYKPEGYPINFMSLDWCYYPSKKTLDEGRPLYSFIKKTPYMDSQINGEWVQDDTRNNYISSWFYFTESKSFTSLEYQVNNQ